MDLENKYGALELQREFLPLMDTIDKVCRDHGVKYSLYGGSLLGAIRHKGFIPWDDDIDLVFDRENYEKFLQIFPETLGADHCIVQDLWLKRVTRKDNPGAGKLPPTGCVDLFVFDSMPQGKAACAWKQFWINTLQGMLKKKIQYEKFSFKHKVLLFGTHCLGRLVPEKAKKKAYDRVSQWGNKKKTPYCNVYNNPYSFVKKGKFRADVMDGYCDVEFEGRSYMATRNWDHVLTVDYGDYMTPPEEQNRVPEHL